VDDVLAQLDAFVANEHGRPGNQLAHFVLALATERAVEGTLRIFVAEFAHPCFPSITAPPAQKLYSTSLVASVSPALSRPACAEPLKRRVRASRCPIIAPPLNHIAAAFGHLKPASVEMPRYRGQNVLRKFCHFIGKLDRRDVFEAPPFVRRAAGRRDFIGTPFVPMPPASHGKGRGHRRAKRSRAARLRA